MSQQFLLAARKLFTDLRDWLRRVTWYHV